MYEPDKRPLSLQTGYLYLLYLHMKELATHLQSVCEKMELTEPWFDPKHRKNK